MFLEDFDYYTISSNTIMGLSYNLLCEDITPILSDSIEDVDKSKVVIIIAPQKTINEKEADKLYKYVYNGGTLILSSSKNTKTESLLAKFNISLSNIFLGPVPWKNPNVPDSMKLNGPEFKEAWHINIDKDPNTTCYYKFDNYHLVTITEVNSGKFIFIADDKFLLSNNLETEMSANQNNVLFIKELIRDVINND